jgi:hypothetical protein
MRLLSNRGHFFVEQFEERFEGARRLLLAPYGDKVDADVVGLQAVEGDVVRAQVAGRCGNNGHPFLGFDSGKHRVHIVQLIVHAGREAVVITGADNRVVDLRGACTLKGDDALPCKIRNANALCFDLAGLGKRYD